MVVKMPLALRRRGAKLAVDGEVGCMHPPMVPSGPPFARAAAVDVTTGAQPT